MSHMRYDVYMKKLYRSKEDKIIAGVCGGMAEYFAVDPTVVRVVFALVSLFSGFLPGVIAYIVLMLIIPVEGEKSIIEAEVVDKK